MRMPLPVPSEISQPFWVGCNNHELLVQQCSGCGKRFFTPAAICPHCTDERLTWVKSPGIGTLYSFTIVHRPASPEIATPYVLATVDLDDGWTMLTRIVDCDPDLVRCDMRVSVRFLSVADNVTLPCFKPLG